MDYSSRWRSSVCKAVRSLQIRTGRDKIPRPFRHALHGTHSKDIIQFHYIELGPRNKAKNTYCLSGMINQAIAGCTQLHAHPPNKAYIHWWLRLHHTSPLPLSFRIHHPSLRMKPSLLGKNLKTKHQYMFAYTAWSNGVVEGLTEELFRSTHALLSELKEQLNSCPYLIPLSKHSFNSSPSL